MLLRPRAACTNACRAS